MAKARAPKQSLDWDGLLKKHPLFSSVANKERALLLSDKVSKKHEFVPDDVILKQGQTGNSLFIVCEGKVSVTLTAQNGDEIDLYTLTDGEVFGEMALFGQRPRAATLVATAPSKLLEIDGDEILSMMKKHHEIANYLLARLSQRLRHTDDMILARRISGIDTSVSDIKTQLDVIMQTTDAKLAAAQAVFDQTNARASAAVDGADRARSDIIANADRGRTRVTWMISTAAGLLALITGVGFVNFERTHRQIEVSAEQVRDSAKTASEAANTAAGAAGNASDSASKAKAAEEEAAAVNKTLQNQLREARAFTRELANLRAESMHTQMVSNIEAKNYPDTTHNFYFGAINNNHPVLRGKLVDNLHQWIIRPDTRPRILTMLNESLKSYQGEMKLDALVATHYFKALVHILDGEMDMSERVVLDIKNISEGDRTVFGDIFDSEKFNPKIFSRVLVAPEKVELRKNRKLGAIKQLYAALQPTN